MARGTTATTKTCVVIGDPVEHSLSPAMHNAGYEHLGIADEYVYVARRVRPAELASFLKEARSSGVRGISCTIPHKAAVIEHIDAVDAVAAEIGAVNTIVNDDGVLKGYNTDWLGAMRSLEKIISFKDKRVVLLGAGGAARAIAYGVARNGGHLTIFNRNVEKAKSLARELGGVARSLDALAEAREADILINATPVGLSPAVDETPLSRELIDSRHVVFDVVYVPHETRLLREARERGARVVYGAEFLLQQGLEQFRLYTGYEPPEAAMREALLGALAGRKG